MKRGISEEKGKGEVLRVEKAQSTHEVYRKKSHFEKGKELREYNNGGEYTVSIYGITEMKPPCTINAC
jgi:Ni/Co efflux regulator RcnB